MVYETGIPSTSKLTVARYSVFLSTSSALLISTAASNGKALSTTFFTIVVLITFCGGVGTNQLDSSLISARYFVKSSPGFGRIPIWFSAPPPSLMTLSLGSGGSTRLTFLALILICLPFLFAPIPSGSGGSKVTGGHGPIHPQSDVTPGIAPRTLPSPFLTR
ncbi:hypothetical protein ABW19_dt0200304 [Dactylella cylindrospora]|nr:hypothetical protein ABW19_dt0200304 [Dactylella cylindrospora]